MIIDPKLLIIRKPEKGIGLRKAASAASAVFFWGMFMYLLLAVCGWIASLFILESVLGEFQSIVSLERNSEMFLQLIAAICLAIWAWAAYNRYRFSGDRDRRRVFTPPLSTDAICEYAGLPKDDVKKMQQAKVVVCHFSPNRRLKGTDLFRSVDDADASDHFAAELAD